MNPRRRRRKNVRHRFARLVQRFRSQVAGVKHAILAEDYPSLRYKDLVP